MAHGPSLIDNCDAAVPADGTESLQQSTMTNSDAPSPKKSENHQDYSSFSAASDDDGEFANVVVNAALNDLKGS